MPDLQLYLLLFLSENLLFISNPHICPQPRFHPPWRSNFSSGWNVEDGSLKLPDRPADRWSTRPVLAWMDLPLGYAPRGIFTHILPLIRKGFFNLCLILIVKDHLAIHLLIGSHKPIVRAPPPSFTLGCLNWISPVKIEHGPCSMAPLIQILDIETVLLKLTVDRNFETSLRLNLALNWNWPFPGQSGHWNGGMQKIRSNQPREQRISKNWFPLHRPLPRILHWESKKITELRQGFSLITSTQFMACFMTYISDIFGLGNSFRRMLHTMYVIVLLLKNVFLLRV